MKLDNLVDSNTTTRKMRDLMKRDHVNKEVKILSKRKNSNPDERNCQPMDGPNSGEDEGVVDPATVAED